MKSLVSMWWLASPLALFLGGGYSFVDADEELDSKWVPALDLGVAYRVHPAVAFGVHSRGSRVTGYEYHDYNIPIFRGVSDAHTLWTADVGLSVQLTPRNGVTLQPWLGAHLSRGTWRSYGTDQDGDRFDVTRPLRLDPMVTGGLVIAVDGWIFDPHRVAVYSNVQFSREAGAYFGAIYDAVTFGLAYRQ